jgi:hypothetical protein
MSQLDDDFFVNNEDNGDLFEDFVQEEVVQPQRLSPNLLPSPQTSPVANSLPSQQTLEDLLLARGVKKKKRLKRDKYIALNPQQQDLVNFLSRHKPDEITSARWRAELCISPAGVKIAVPEPMVAIPVGLLDVRSAVLDWSAQRLDRDNVFLHLDLSNILTLTFKRCVHSPMIDLDVPFDTLHAALVQGDADIFHKAQDEFAAYGIMLIPTMTVK